MHNFASEKEVNDAMSCSEKDPYEADAENPAENDATERLSDLASEKVVNDGESCLENELNVDGDPTPSESMAENPI